jgi:hypothetical protein
MILEDSQLSAFILGFIIALFFKSRKVKGYEIKEIGKIR